MVEIKYMDEDGKAFDTPQVLVDPGIIEQVLAVPAGPGEKPYHVDACRIWLNGGNPLTHKQVADKTGKSAVTIGGYSSRYRWRERLQTIENLIRMDISEQAAIDMDHEMRQMLDSVNKAMTSYDKAVTEDKVKWRGGDIRGLVETKMLIIGKPTDRHELISTNPAVDRILDDSDTIKLAGALFVRLGLGQGDASGSG